MARLPVRSLALLLLALPALLASCGGGGGGGGGGGDDEDDPRREAALALLESCPEPAQEAVRLLGVFREVLDAGAGSPPTLSFQEVVGQTVTWTLDSAGDGSDDLSGSVRFLDESGSPITPFDLNQLVTSGQRLVTFFVGLPANTQVVLPFAGLGENVSGQFVAVLGTGVVDRMSGNLADSSVAGCEGVFSFGPTPFATLGGLFPTVTFALQILDDMENVVTGTMEVPGSSTAMLSVRFGGSADGPFEFRLDLVSGAVSE